MAQNIATRERHPAYVVLRHLALHGETDQQMLATLVSYRTLVRVLQRLEGRHLVKRNQRRRNPRHYVGAPPNNWVLTLDGVLTVLRWGLKDEEVESVAYNYRDASPIFAKWGYIRRSPEVLGVAMSLIKSFPYVGEDEVDRFVGESSGSPMHAYTGIVMGVEAVHQRDFIAHMLAMEPILAGAFFVQDRPAICDYFDYLMKDLDLRRIVDRIFREEESKYRVIQGMRKIFELQ